MTKASSAEHVAPTPDQTKQTKKPKPRLRLPPEVRVQQILDQAMVEFSKHGFEATRMDNIAQGCGLSKGGLYAHFASKYALYEAFLTRSLGPVDLTQMDLPRPVPVRELVTWIMDQMYDTRLKPNAAATMRLLIAEGSRVPQLLKVWGEQVIEPHLAMLSELLNESSAGWVGKPSIIVHEPWLVISPVMHAMVSKLIAGEQQAFDVAPFKRAHVELLCELLEPALRLGDPREEAASSEAGRA